MLELHRAPDEAVKNPDDLACLESFVGLVAYGRNSPSRSNRLACKLVLVLILVVDLFWVLRRTREAAHAIREPEDDAEGGSSQRPSWSDCDRKKRNRLGDGARTRKEAMLLLSQVPRGGLLVLREVASDLSQGHCP